MQFTTKKNTQQERLFSLFLAVLLLISRYTPQWEVYTKLILLTRTVCMCACVFANKFVFKYSCECICLNNFDMMSQQK